MKNEIRITPPLSSPLKKGGGRERLVFSLKKGGIAVLPTDTLYGVVARACDKEAVRRLYRLRRRTSRKPFVILVSSVRDLAAFGVTPNAAAVRFLTRVWPGKISVILPCKRETFSYLHLGTKSLAFRLPKSARLRSLLRKTGPLVAPSANPEGKKPAETIAQARKYFGDAVDVYVHAGRLKGKPSTLVSLVGEKPHVIRHGAGKV